MSKTNKQARTTRTTAGPRRIGRRAKAAAASVAVLAVVAGFLVWHGSGNKPATVNNVSRNYRACLMTDSADTADAQTAQEVWAGVQRAASTGKVNAERLPLTSPDPRQALPYFNGAVQQHCGIIVAVGAAMKPATENAAAENTGQHFILVGATSSHTNIVTVTASDADGVSDAVYADVMSAAAAKSSTGRE
jgi:basic membrane lipoprotein Med (substrate-binding protein (PBP1-ABC) superfamily)